MGRDLAQPSQLAAQRRRHRADERLIVGLARDGPARFLRRLEPARRMQQRAFAELVADAPCRFDLEPRPAEEHLPRLDDRLEAREAPRSGERLLRGAATAHEQPCDRRLPLLLLPQELAIGPDVKGAIVRAAEACHERVPALALTAQLEAHAHALPQRGLRVRMQFLERRERRLEQRLVTRRAHGHARERDEREQEEQRSESLHRLVVRPASGSTGAARGPSGRFRDGLSARSRPTTPRG
jgi:hypothetical protein